MFSHVRAKRWHQSFAITAVRAVLMLNLAVAMSAQEADIQVVDFTIGCREEPSPPLAVSMAVATAWVEENALFADIAVANHSSFESSFLLVTPVDITGMRRSTMVKGRPSRTAAACRS